MSLIYSDSLPRKQYSCRVVDAPAALPITLAIHACTLMNLTAGYRRGFSHLRGVILAEIAVFTPLVMH